LIIDDTGFPNMGINDQGQIVGVYNKAGADHGFLYDPTAGTYTTLDAP
jgi:probable HAF family extracellular repeat protein